MSTPRMLTLDCGTFDGSVAASRWLARLKWDFERAGHDPTNVPASQYIKILNMQCEKDAATYLDSVPHLSAIVEKADEGMATAADVTTLDAALKERFPARIMDHDSSAGDINSLHQEKDEALLAYYNRALSMLHRVGCRDSTIGITLSMPEQTVLTSVVRQFVKGLADAGLRRQALQMSAMASNSLRSAYNTVRDARQVLEEREAEDRRVHDEMRTKMLEDVVTKQNPGQPVDQVIAHQLAQMQLTNPVAANYLGYLNQIQPVAFPFSIPQLTSGQLTPGMHQIQPQQQMQVQQWPSNTSSANAPPPYFNNNQGYAQPSTYNQQQSSYNQPSKQSNDRGAYRAGRDIGLDFTKKDGNLPELPDRKTSSNDFVSGKRIPKDNDIICIRCGTEGHKRPDCTGRQLQPWESAYIKALVFPSSKSFNAGHRPPHGIIDVHSAQIYYAQDVAYQQSVATQQTTQNPGTTATTDELRNPWDRTDVIVGGRHLEFTPVESTEDVIPPITESEEARLQADARSAEIVELSGKVANILEVLSDESIDADDRVLRLNALVAQAESSNSNDRKQWMETILQRPRAHVQKVTKPKKTSRVVQIPNANSREKVTINDIVNTPEPMMMPGLMVDPQPPKRPRRQGLTPIVAREGLPPIDILEMARKIVLDVPLLDLMQLSPEFSKALRSMSQRVVVKRPKKDKGKGKIAEAHSVQITLNAAGHITTTNDPTSNTRLFSKRYAATRPFRVDCIIMTASTKHYVPDNAAQADQGSEMNIISPKLVKQCNLIQHPLAGIGFEGLKMGAANGAAYFMTHFVAMDVVIHGIKREIWACVRTQDTDQSVLLLLGMPWLFDVRALIDPWGARMIIGNSNIGEALVEIEGPAMDLAESQKLILSPADDHTDLTGRDRLLEIVDFDDDDSSDDDADSDDDHSEND